MDSPHGDLETTEGAEMVAIRIGEEFPKHQPVHRLLAELRYGYESARELRDNPSVFVANQMPVISLTVVQLLHRKLPTIIWLQDIQGGLASITPVPQAQLIGKVLGYLERRALRRALLVMPISEAMASEPLVENLPPANVYLRPNWGSPQDVLVEPKDNEWSRRHGLHERKVALYSGTLGIKHDATFLLELARKLRVEEPEARVVVVSSGPSWRRLGTAARTESLDNLICLPLQPYEEISQVFATSDVLLASLLSESAAYAVPSKVLAYLCAGRPIAALVPMSNSISTLLNADAVAGLASESSSAIHDFVLEVFRDEFMAKDLGLQARKFAEAEFDVDRVATELAARWLETISAAKTK